MMLRRRTVCATGNASEPPAKPSQGDSGLALTLTAMFASTLALVSPTAGYAQATETTPDFTGVWQLMGGPAGEGIKGPSKEDLPFQPWHRTLYDDFLLAYADGSPVVDNRTICLPDGSVDVLFTPYAIQFLQTPDKVIMLMEFNNQMRIVYLNEDHPTDPEPSWNGHSVGHFEGDTLIVDTIGFNDKTPLMTLYEGGMTRTDMRHTEQLHIVERYTLLDGGSRLRNELTIDDPGAFTGPWTVTLTSAKRDYRMPEFVCADAPLDLEG